MSDDKPFLCTAPGCGQVCIYTTVRSVIAKLLCCDTAELFLELQCTVDINNSYASVKIAGLLCFFLFYCEIAI